MEEADLVGDVVGEVGAAVDHLAEVLAVHRAVHVHHLADRVAADAQVLDVTVCK